MNNAAPALAVFCDYDGTLAVQDVGASIAARYLGEQRARCQAQLARGELATPWAYNMALFDGLRLPARELDAFLAGIAPMPGAHELVAWCAARGVPFRVLSDGFDYNIDRLQKLHGLHFAYQANHLRYEADVWRIAPGAPDPQCACGTGVCKAACIRAFRARAPAAQVVHIGNGRVSDLCASLVADRVFAKDTLAEELHARGHAFTRFEDLHDVRRELAALAGAAPR